jgi:hypothetical protein
MNKCRIAAVFALLALVAAVHGQTPADKKKPLPKTREDVQLLRYEIAVSNPGTRSEGFSGKVFIAGAEAPDSFAFVEAYGVRYVNVPFTQTWKWHGYTPDIQPTDQTPNEGKAAGRFADADATRGWYEARVDDMKEGTPATWIFAGSSSEGAWIDPIRFAEYCASIKTK